MAFENGHLLAGCQVPKSYHVIPAARYKRLAIMREHHGVDYSRASFEYGCEFMRTHAPQHHRPVVIPHPQHLPVRRESHTPDCEPRWIFISGASWENRQFATFSQSPKLGCIIMAARSEQFAIGRKRQPVYLIGMCNPGRYRLAGHDIPQYYRAAPMARCHDLPVTGE